MNPLIDCHTHIHQHESIEHKEIINRSLSANVKIIVCAGTSIEDSIHSISLSDKFSNVYSGVGIHPTELKTYGEKESNKIKDLSQNKKVICISEIGLDYQDDKTNKILQKEAFRDQLNIAKSVNLPVIFHVREKNDDFEAWNCRKDIIDILRTDLSVDGVAHYFQGNWNFAKKLLDLGIYISFAKPILRIKELEETIKKVPSDMFLVETDSYPQPFKKNRNKWTEPYQLPEIIKKISDIRKSSVEKISIDTTRNTLSVFSKHHILEGPSRNEFHVHALFPKMKTVLKKF